MAKSPIHGPKQAVIRPAPPKQVTDAQKASDANQAAHQKYRDQAMVNSHNLNISGYQDGSIPKSLLDASKAADKAMADHAAANKKLSDYNKSLRDKKK
ncbi:MAG: hypothetical protein LPJ92_05720 [Rhodobacterales bacterium]|nr:hypothetical protein [Rhodobacterales bacterium]MDX5389814.1 hypothetical protein [Rhodobacterales bacterium]MDX5489511.1 hypothetical protein [Rhodobacterales bacterium]